PAARAGDLAALLPHLLSSAAPSTAGEEAARHNGTPVTLRAATLSEEAMTSTENPLTAGLLDTLFTPATASAGTPLTINWLVHEPFPGSGGHTGIFRMI